MDRGRVLLSLRHRHTAVMFDVSTPVLALPVVAERLRLCEVRSITTIAHEVFYQWSSLPWFTDCRADFAPL